MKRLLKMAVIQVLFKCNDKWYVQKDGLAKVASLIIANLWLKQYETALLGDIPEMFCPKTILTEYVPSAIRKSRTGQKV